MYYICMIVVEWDDFEYGKDYSWEELSGIHHTSYEDALKEKYEYQYKEVMNTGKVTTIRIDEV